MGRDSSVGIATRYGLDGPGIESRWGARFSAPFQTGPGAYPASCTMGTGSFAGVKRSGRGADHPPPSKCRGQERVGLYLYSPSGHSWPVMGAPHLCPWSNLSCADSLATVVGPVVVVIPVRSPTSPFSFFFFFTWLWVAESFPCTGVSLVLWPS